MRTYERDFTIGLRDVQAFHLMQVHRRWLKAILGFGLAGGLVGVLYLSSMGEDLSAGSKAATVIIMALLTMAGVALGLDFSTRMRVKRQVRASGREEYVQEIVIDGFGVHAAVGKERAKLDFDKLVKVWETRKAFYLFITEDQAWILPKEQMADQEEETAQLREIFDTVIDSRRLKLRKD